MTNELTFASLASEAGDLIRLCRQQDIKLATAESCTGGLIAALLTEVPGSSDVIDRAFVTYSNAAKTEMLNVPADMIERHGAVSESVALAMVAGALSSSAADIVVAVTGIAGPGGGSAEKPVGLVHIAAGDRDGRRYHERCTFPDHGRHAIRLSTVGGAFVMIRRLASQVSPG